MALRAEEMNVAYRKGFLAFVVATNLLQAEDEHLAFAKGARDRLFRRRARRPKDLHDARAA
ncbi:MAG: hypothetical protein IPK71_36940 [Myxococcales bacterium]|nr:hypothetical protein [Myxococcales bacterium]